MPDKKTSPGLLSEDQLRGLLEKYGMDYGSFIEEVSNMDRHSPTSPVISTLFRLAYLFLILLVIPYATLAILFPGAWDIWSELRWWVDLAVRHHQIIIGLMGSDFIHWGLDILTTEHAKKKKVELFGMPLASSMCR